MNVVGLLLATECDSGQPLALCRLGGLSAVEHAVEALRAAVSLVVVVAPSAYVDEVAAVTGAVVLPGPADRHASLHCGLTGLDSPNGMVVVHDIVRPLVPGAVVRRVVDAVRAGAPAAVAAVEMTETVKEIGPDARVVRTVPRETLVRMHGPVAVPAGVLAAAHESCSGAGPVAYGAELSFVDGSGLGLPVRDAGERALAEALLGLVGVSGSPGSFGEQVGGQQ